MGFPESLGLALCIWSLISQRDIGVAVALWGGSGESSRTAGRGGPEGDYLEFPKSRRCPESQSAGVTPGTQGQRVPVRADGTGSEREGS